MPSKEPVSRTSKQFLEDRLRDHAKVESFENPDYCTYVISRKVHNDKLTILLVTKYVFGILDYHAVRRDRPDVHCIVLSTMFNNCTPEAKDQAIEDNVGLFKMRDLIGALNWKNFWEYNVDR